MTRQVTSLPTDGAEAPSGRIASWTVSRAQVVVFTASTCDGCECDLPTSQDAVCDLLETSVSWLRNHPEALLVGVALQSNPAMSTSSVVLSLEPVVEG